MTALKPAFASAATWAFSAVGETQRPAYLAPVGAGAMTWYIRIGTGARERPRRWISGSATPRLPVVTGPLKVCWADAVDSVAGRDGEDDPQPQATTAMTIINDRSARDGTPRT